MKFDENTPLLTGDYDGDTVVLVAQVDGVRDKKFARNFVTAKNLADQGRVSRIVVKSVGLGVRAEDALRRQLGSGHAVVEVCRGECAECPFNAPEKPAKGFARGGKVSGGSGGKGGVPVGLDGGYVLPKSAIDTRGIGVFKELNETYTGVQGEGTSPPDTDR